MRNLSDARPGRAPSTVLFHEHAHHAVLSVIFGFALRAPNRGDVGENRNVRRSVSHIDLARLNIEGGKFRVLDHVDLLFLVYDRSAGVNFHEVVGEEPCCGVAVMIVRGVEPDVVEDSDRGGNVFCCRHRILGRLSQRRGSRCDDQNYGYRQPVAASHCDPPSELGLHSIRYFFGGAAFITTPVARQTPSCLVTTRNTLNSPSMLLPLLSWP